jgi:RNA polymerase sigma-70 factor, ECF subfamily
MPIHDDAPCRSEFRLLPDDVLMTYLKDGHQDALAVLFNRYRRLVLSVAWHVLRDRGEAEDLVQSVFLEILQSAAKFDAAKGTVKSWILQYAYHRSFNRRKYLSLRGIPNYPEPFIPVRETSMGWWNSSFEIVESKWFVQEALGHLNGKQRKILELAFYEGLSMREASERTGESFDTVRHHFYRAIDNLRSMIQNGTGARLTKYRDEGLSALTEAGARSPHQRLAGVKSLRSSSFRSSRTLQSNSQKRAEAVHAQA